LDDAIWLKVASSGAFVNTMTGGTVDIRTDAKLAWDDKFLYVAFNSMDSDIWGTFKKRDDELWTQEAVEVFLDANSDGKDYVELQVSPAGVIFDSYLPSYRKNENDWNSKLQAKVSVDGTLNKRTDKDKGWTVEMAIPWSDVKGKGTYDLKLPPAVGDVWRINMFRVDSPSEKVSLAAAWSAPLVGDFHKLDRFGELVFGDENGKAPSNPGLMVLPPGVGRVPGAERGPSFRVRSPMRNPSSVRELRGVRVPLKKAGLPPTTPPEKGK
ncbi:MAG: carbohydrate-binding family 9-like protein, partial [Pseudomonadota bacterium]